jgi:hypothetical protein
MWTEHITVFTTELSRTEQTKLAVSLPKNRTKKPKHVKRFESLKSQAQNRRIHNRRRSQYPGVSSALTKSRWCMSGKSLTAFVTERFQVSVNKGNPSQSHLPKSFQCWFLEQIDKIDICFCSLHYFGETLISMPPGYRIHFRLRFIRYLRKCLT